MPQVGSAGQRRLLDSRVLIVGAGGLGSPVAIYLALAGIGTLGIVDYDVVDVTNLQRQILHHDADVGRSKVASARDTLLAYNPDLEVVTFEEPITSENAMEMMAGFDVVVSGADNFAARYLINDAAYLSGKPLVDGSILMFDGRATTYMPGKGCYRCVFPDPPPPGEVPNCSEAGVLGMLPGMVGSIQAAETVKVLLGTGRAAGGAAAADRRAGYGFQGGAGAKGPGVPAVRDEPTVRELIDYEVFCGVPGS